MKKMPEFGLPQRTMSEIRDIFAGNARVKKVMIYGSRAMGNYEDGSDIDLTMFGDKLTLSDAWRISGQLDDSSIPYMVDLSVYDELNHAKLKDHINRVGKVFYDRFAGWEKRSFEKCLIKVKSAAKIPKKDYLSEGKYPIVSQEVELISGFTNIADAVINVETPLIIFGDHTQVLKYIDFNFALGADGVKLLKPTSDINAKFFFYSLLCQMPKKTGYARHYRFLKELKLNIPNLREQQRIVAKLDTAFSEIDAAIAAAEKKSIQIENLKAAILTDALTPQSEEWQALRLSDVCEVRPKKEQVKNMISDSSVVSFMGMKDLGINTKYAVPRESKILSSVYGSYTYFATDDVLLAKITPCFENGKVGIARKLENNIGFGSSEFSVYRCGERIIPDFLYYFFMTDEFRMNGIKQMSGAVGQKRVDKEFLKNAIISLPSVKEQAAIVAKLDAALTEIESASRATERKISELKVLKTALLNQELSYSKGELC